ncbi:MAG TPA: branched-chain amino acid ABC transporter permease [Feifaniaceae bacterium]|nr:branched-chain amino acid ABC transporter permease [Feifaniaceae bacterium]
MNPYQIGLIIQACVSVIAVAAVFILTGLGGMFSLGQAAYLCIGAYTTFLLMQYAGLPLLLAAFLGVASGAILAFIVGLLTLKLRRDYFTLMSVALGQAIPALVVVFKDVTRGALGYTKIPKIENLIWITIAITALVLFCARNFKYSRFGRMCLALKSDELAAKSFGINVYRLKIKTYILASAIGCVAGILLALRSRYIDNNMFSWAYSAEMQIFMFFGGTNSLTGSAISAFLLKLLPSFLRDVTVFGQSMEEYRTILYCILILLVINFRPKGLLGEKELGFAALRRVFAGRGGKSKAPEKGRETHE